MRNVADQLLVLAVKNNLLFGGLLQPEPHLFKIGTQLSDLIIILNVYLKIQIPVPDVPGCFLQSLYGIEDTPVDPYDQETAGHGHDQYNGYEHLSEKFTGLRSGNLDRLQAHKSGKYDRDQKQRNSDNHSKGNNEFCLQIQCLLLRFCFLKELYHREGHIFINFL